MTPHHTAPHAYVARAESARGEVVLRWREHDGGLELRVNGVFVMDTIETSTERMLARVALDALPTTTSDVRVLIGGLGLGFTLAEVAADPRVGRVVVAEIEPALVGWHREGLIPAGTSPLTDPRVHVEVGDVQDIVADQPPGSFDLILLDVDNGPGFLVYDANAPVYRAAFLETCRQATGPGGTTAVWSADPSEALTAAMRDVFAQCEQRRLPVRLGQRETTYHLFLGRG